MGSPCLAGARKLSDIARPLTGGLDWRGAAAVHEFATNPEARLAYSSYYAAGCRVLRFGGARGLRETGRFIDEDDRDDRDDDRDDRDDDDDDDDRDD